VIIYYRHFGTTYQVPSSWVKNPKIKPAVPARILYCVVCRRYDSCRILSPPGTGQISSHFLLASAFLSRRHPISLLCLLSICFSLPFLLLLLLLHHFLCFLIFHIGSLSVLHLLLRLLSSRPSSPWSTIKTLDSHLNFSVTYFFIVSLLMSLLFFPLFQPTLCSFYRLCTW